MDIMESSANEAVVENINERKDQKLIRNICILAHVDHGKTTLADHLIASNGGGVLHPKQAGKLRFMDYLDEEQRRAITMKSSSIALNFNDYSINLIDSPGHMDFCSEVSTAARLSDGALVLVDAVEGVHIQTHAVLRQAWIEKLTPCLVLNKVDRLICELNLSPKDAYTKLLQIIHEVNGIVSTYKSEKYLSDVDSLLSVSPDNVDKENLEFVEYDEEDTFQPQKGNVIFACGLDGWGFRINDFAKIYATKYTETTVTTWQKALWGPRYFVPKTNGIVPSNKVPGASKDPMFVHFILKQLWQVYQTLGKNGDCELLQKVIKSFNLSIPPRELQNRDPRAVLQSVMSRWLPLSDTVLSMVVECIPDPIASQSFRISRLLPERDGLLNSDISDVLAEAELVRKSVEACDSSPSAPCVAFVSKMFAVPTKMLPRGDILNNSSDDVDSGECFLAFARIFSGVLLAGQRIFVLSSLYDPLKVELKQKHVQVAEVQSLYLMMGQGLKPVSIAEAGNIVAIRGLGQHILKSATLSSTINCWPFSSMTFQVTPMLKVAVEPSDPADMSALVKGLRLLNRADPFVEVTVSGRGEHVLAAAGEVHLERCIKDLKERFAKVNLEVSAPLVSFKETIEGEMTNPLDNLKFFSDNCEYVEKTTQNGRCVVCVQVVKLPESLTKLLNDTSELLRDILGGESEQALKSLETLRGSIVEDENPIEALRKRMMDAVESDISTETRETEKDRFEKYRELWKQLFRRIWALGPGQVGPNILFTPGIGKSMNGSVLIKGHPYVSDRLGFQDLCEHNEASAVSSSETDEVLSREIEGLESSVLSGFQLATSAGPLCDEPMWSLGFFVEVYMLPIDKSSSEDNHSIQQSEQYGIITGQVMIAVKEACRAAVLQRKPRIVEPLYFCELNTPTEHLGSMYAVLHRRRAETINDEMQEGSSLFTVQAYVPVAESFGFADELRRWTSGACSALLVLSHWKTLPEDPFFVPKTEEEIEEFGDGSSVLQNTSRKLIDAVRRRKGLPVEDKVVQHATKQRTLARKV